MEGLFLYEILGEAWGVVKAENKEEAEQKVREAYKKHDTSFDEYVPIIITSKEEENCWFSDSPDVLEVYG